MRNEWPYEYDPRSRERGNGGARHWGGDRDRSEGRGFDRPDFEGGSRSESRRGYDDREALHEEAPIVKVIEVIAQSPHSWEDAARRALHETSRTVRDIKSIYVKDFEAIIDRDRIVEFRLVAKVSFAVRDQARQRSRG